MCVGKCDNVGEMCTVGLVSALQVFEVVSVFLKVSALLLSLSLKMVHDRILSLQEVLKLGSIIILCHQTKL